MDLKKVHRLEKMRKFESGQNRGVSAPKQVNSWGCKLSGFIVEGPNKLRRKLRDKKYTFLYQECLKHP